MSRCAVRVTLTRGRRTLGAAVVGTVIAGVLLANCGFPTQESPSRFAEDPQLPSLVTEPTGLPSKLETVSVWFVRGERLEVASRRVPAPTGPASVITALAAGVSKAEGERGLRSAIPAASMVVGAEASGGTASVQLASEFLDIPAGDQVLALGQIVYTLTDLRGVGRVRFTIDSVPVVVPLPGGRSTQDSVSRREFVALTVA